MTEHKRTNALVQIESPFIKIIRALPKKYFNKQARCLIFGKVTLKYTPEICQNQHGQGEVVNITSYLDTENTSRLASCDKTNEYTKYCFVDVAIVFHTLV